MIQNYYWLKLIEAWDNKPKSSAMPGLSIPYLVGAKKYYQKISIPSEESAKILLNQIFDTFTGRVFDIHHCSLGCDVIGIDAGYLGIYYDTETQRFTENKQKRTSILIHRGLSIGINDSKQVAIDKILTSEIIDEINKGNYSRDKGKTWRPFDKDNIDEIPFIKKCFGEDYFENLA